MLIARGGQGEVLKVHDAVLNREVALKRLKPVNAADGERFLQEARLTAALEHPGIVPLHDIGVLPDGSACLVMRRIAGESLAQRLDRLPELGARLHLVSALVRACHAVAFAHERGIIHRDLKPQNIMLGPHGESYVVDWGLARPDALTTTTRVEGTPAYMAPEQARGEPADMRSDVFGLGACLYQVLTGKPPGQGSSLNSVLSNSARGQLDRVSALAPEVPEDLQAICHKALAADPAARYPTAQGLAIDLEAWLAGRAVSARRYSPWEQLRRALDANRPLVMLGAAAVAVVLALVMVDAWRVRRERDRARAFATRMLVEIPGKLASARENVELVNSVTANAEQWLVPGELAPGEFAMACDALRLVGSHNLELQRLDEALVLAQRATALARMHDSVETAECELRSLSLAVDAARDREAGLLELERALGSARLETPGLRSAAANGHHVLAAIGWGTPRGRQHALEEARLLGELARTAPETAGWFAEQSLQPVLALWSDGRPQEAIALGDQLLAAASPLCAPQEHRLFARRGCASVLSAAAVVRRWTGGAGALEDRLEQASETLMTVEPDNAELVAEAAARDLERGDFARAERRSRRVAELGREDYARRARHGALVARARGSAPRCSGDRERARRRGGRLSCRGRAEAPHARHVAAVVRPLVAGPAPAPGRPFAHEGLHQPLL